MTLIGPPMPHALSKTESYMGYTLPEGAAIINCVWPYMVVLIRISDETNAMMRQLRSGPSITRPTDAQTLEILILVATDLRIHYKRHLASTLTRSKDPIPLSVWADVSVQDITLQFGRSSWEWHECCGHSTSAISWTPQGIPSLSTEMR